MRIWLWRYTLNKIAKTGLLVISLFLVLLPFYGCNSSNTFESSNSGEIFWSPYQELNWSEIGHYDSEFHTHPGLGDEQYDPHQTIDRYHEEGYKILALAGHDYDIPKDHIQTIYPWTKLSEIFEIIKHVENPTENNKTYGKMANEPYQARDPVKLGMVSVEGNEVTGPHHLISLFCSVNSGEANEAATLKKIKEKGGLAYFAHPGRYVESLGLTAYWYADLYLRFDVLIGQSVFNRIDSHPKARAFYDKIVHILGYQRPIWLYGEDDMHDESTLGWNRDVILLENFRPGSMHPDIPDGSAPDVFKALKNGYSYLWKPSLQYNKRSFNIIDVIVSDKEIEIIIDHQYMVDEIRWVTHNPYLDISETIFYGHKISRKNLPEYSKFVRAEIEGHKGIIFTQPFYLKQTLLGSKIKF